MKLTSTIAAVAGLIATVNAHATFQYLWTDATTSTNTCVRTPPSNNPVGTEDATLSCNVNGDTGVAGKCTVAAGSTVQVEMHQQPGDRDCTTEAIGGNHDGPILIYLTKVDDASTAKGTTAKWYKIWQNGLITADATTETYYWATDAMNDNCGKVPFTIPSDIEPGDYLLRAEVIALHVAGSLGGAQHYMSCYQITVTGGGSANPANGLVAFPGAYSETDPGILFNLYTSFTTYTIPGPTVYTPGGSSPTTTSKPSGTTSKSSSTTTTTTTTSSKPTTTSSTSKTTTQTSTTTTASGPGQTLYGQCGGTGYSGPTTCASGTCKYSNAYYSQCLP
ncbi:hypothetical protein FRC04_001640 [Tulasnella sp. 424]|nr:hypothetical protein FRC04_001640 [Tulasnella sp. 424]KAG8968667.1 hypothetical protein FRC05_001473 [Tulasnella sp. 425]